MPEPAQPPSANPRLRRLSQVLVAVFALWILVTGVRSLLPESPLKLARVAVEQGQFDSAVEQYLRHLSREPQDWNARLELGFVLSTIDRPQALAEFRKIPKEAEAYWDACR